MINSFNCKETENIFRRIFSCRLPHDIQKIALRKLLIIDAATNMNDLRIPPSNHLEMLKGNRKGQYSIRINDQWRICFQWKSESAHNVEIVDYH